MKRRAKIKKAWYHLTSSLWFVPALMAVGALVLALTLSILDRAVDLHDQEDEGWWLIQSSAESARQILTTIASASATVLGVVFSITIIALQLASTQYSPRVLREFMRDRGSQIVMGTFIATFVYALVMARTVRDDENGLYFVPIIGLTAGILLALGSIAALIYFINHIAESIQAANLIATLATATIPLVDRAFPGSCGQPAEDLHAPDPPGAPVPAPLTGYIQVIEADDLLELARRHDAVIEMQVTIGDFIAEGAELALVYAATAPDEDFQRDLHGFVAIGRRRTLQQDLAFGVRQISDIAVKAMSPSINDPTTALTCLDHCGVILRRMAMRPDPVARRAGADGRLRVVVHGSTFESVAWAVFTPMRVYASGDPAVVLRLLDVLGATAKIVDTDDRRDVIWNHVRLIGEAADQGLQGTMEREMVNERILSLGRVLGRRAQPLLLSLRRDERADAPAG